MSNSIPLSDFRVLIVCRGPIAMEALEVARGLGMPPPHMIVSKREVFEAANAFAPWAEHTDLYEKLHIVDDYKDQDAILGICARHGLRGVYVGYGMNAENFHFVRRCEEAGVIPITPPASVMEFSASKFRAKKHVRDTLGIRVLPGSDRVGAMAAEGAASDEELIKAVEEEVGKLVADNPGGIIRLKAVQSGGGKGQRLVTQVSQAAAAVRQIWAEIGATGVGGNKGVLVEANLAHPRHWEVQVFSDGETCVHFGARECSIQNAGSQKFVEVSLHPKQFDHYIESLDAKKDAELIELLRDEGRRVEETCNAAVEILKSLNYRGAGTVEFLISEDKGGTMYGKPHFMEINSRIQVEHRVSEAVSKVRGRRVRLVGEQFRIACGQKLGYTQAEIDFAGYSTELRINTSNSNFLIGASGSVIDRYQIPERSETFYYDDGGAAEAFEQGIRRSWAVPNFDSNFALAVFIAGSQTESLRFARTSTEAFRIHGNEQLRTTRPFHLAVLSLLGSSLPYGKVRTDFSEILLAFGALIHHGVSRIEPREIDARDPLRRILLRALAVVRHDPMLAVALGFECRRLRAEGGGAGEILHYLVRLIQIEPFAEERRAIEAAKGDLPPALGRILEAIEKSGIYEFQRRESDLEFTIPAHVSDSRERQILIEELKDATVQAVVPREMPGPEIQDLKKILQGLGRKVVDLIQDSDLLDKVTKLVNACIETLDGRERLTRDEFEIFHRDVRDVKWTLRKARLDMQVEVALLGEVGRAEKVIRGPNVVVPLAGTIFLKPAPDKPNFVEPDDEVTEDETVLALLENMKMFIEIRAHMTGTIKEVRVENERPVLPGDVIMVIE